MMGWYQVGALVYCRVVMANKDMECELSCTSPHLKKDWVTGETLFGELTAGYCFKTSLSLARTYVWCERLSQRIGFVVI